MSTTHQQFADMIPWWINGRLQERERLAFECHLQQCDDCRRDVANEQALVNRMTEDPRVEYAPGASLQALLGRIDAEESLPTTSLNYVKHTDKRPNGSPWTRWLVAATLVEAIGIAVLTGALIQSAHSTRLGNDDRYRTVTTVAPTNSSASLRVIFAPSMTLNEFSKLLQELKLEVVSGPSPAGVYSLAISGDESLANELAALRSRPDVRFAEPIGAATR